MSGTRPGSWRGRLSRFGVRIPVLAGVILWVGCAGWTRWSGPGWPEGALRVGVGGGGVDWKVRSAQAVWVPEPGSSGITGDLVAGISPDGRAWLEFTKGPVVVVRAWWGSGGCGVWFPARRVVWSGRPGEASRWIWTEWLGRLGSGQEGATDAFDFTVGGARLRGVWLGPGTGVGRP